MTFSVRPLAPDGGESVGPCIGGGGIPEGQRSARERRRRLLRSLRLRRGSARRSPLAGGGATVGSRGGRLRRSN